jgi:tRNA pseudouridine(38-40) synthase
VHATSQIVHADVPDERPLTAWVRGVNAHLPSSVAVLWAHAVPERSTRASRATARHYDYLLLARPERPGLMAGRVGWYHRALDAGAMREAAALVTGPHDFSAFRAAECQAKVAGARRCAAFDVDARRPVRFSLSADAFLHHMVRNLVGALVTIGAGKARAGLDARAARRARPHARPGDVRARRPLLRRRRLRRVVRIAVDAPRRRARGADADDADARSRSAASRASRTRSRPARAGADAIGLIFWPGRRAASTSSAHARSRRAAAVRATVGLFVDPVGRRGARRARRGRRCRRCSSTGTRTPRSAARSAGPTSRRSRWPARAIC